MKFLVCLVMFLAFWSRASTVKLYCCIVCDNDGGTPHSCESISNKVEEVNKIFSQVAMRFSIEMIASTNSTYLTNIDYSNAAQRAEICGLTDGTDGLELYFVRSITEDVNAFCSSSGIVVGRGANGRTLAHEIGHACGLSDIYAFCSETNLVISGSPTKLRMPHDWGWYPDYVTQSNIIERLLMYGYYSSNKGDISRGDVYGLWYEQVWNPPRNAYDKVWQLGLAPVGFKLHGNRHPVSE